jgi:hypothetical protein
VWSRKHSTPFLFPELEQISWKTNFLKFIMSIIKSKRDRTFWICFGVLIILSILACIFARFMAVFPGDVGVTLWIQSLANEPLTLTMKGISFILGGPGAIITVIIFASIVWWRIGRLEAVMILIGGIVSLLNYTFKDAINRPRPAPPLIQILTHEQQSSFPSGHSFFTFLILGLLTYFALRELPKTRPANIILSRCGSPDALIRTITNISWRPLAERCARRLSDWQRLFDFPYPYLSSFQESLNQGSPQLNMRP